MESAVHRVIEQRAACCGEAFAIVDGRRTITYRALNHRANALARRLMACGFRRQCLATVVMTPSIDLAVLLLAVLKAGGCYAWVTREDPLARTVPAFSFQGIRSGTGDRALALDLETLLTADGGSANLPVMTRGSDAACVLRGAHGDYRLPHETIVALRHCHEPNVQWTGAPGALDLWVALMHGATASISSMATAGTRPAASFESAA